MLLTKQQLGWRTSKGSWGTRGGFRNNKRVKLGIQVEVQRAKRSPGRRLSEYCQLTTARRKESAGRRRTTKTKTRTRVRAKKKRRRSKILYQRQCQEPCDHVHPLLKTEPRDKNLISERDNGLAALKKSEWQKEFKRFCKLWRRESFQKSSPFAPDFPVLWTWDDLTKWQTAVFINNLTKRKTTLPSLTSAINNTCISEHGLPE